SGPFANTHSAPNVELAARYRVPTIYPYRFQVLAGGLVSYGLDLVDSFWSAAAYVDRIMRGEKPANLPVQSPTKFSLAVNLKIAKALPPWYLATTACGVLRSAHDCRPRKALLHHSHRWASPICRRRLCVTGPSADEVARKSRVEDEQHSRVTRGLPRGSGHLSQVAPSGDNSAM